MWPWVSYFTSLNHSHLIYENGIIHLSHRVALRLNTLMHWNGQCRGTLAGVSQCGFLPPHLSLQTHAEICYENHMASVCIYFSIFPNAFCPNLYFYHMNSCMQVGVLMCVFMCFYWLSPRYGQWHIPEVCAHTGGLAWLCWWVGIICRVSVECVWSEMCVLYCTWR